MSCCDSPSLLPVDVAIARLLEKIQPINQTEWVPLTQASHRITAKDILSGINVPSFANSAMDGYAVRLDCLAKTMTLRLAGKSMAGRPFTGDWPAGCCIRIMTGAVVPDGADAVVMQEKTHIDGDNVTFSHVPNLNENIRPIADDLGKGELVLSKGTLLTVREIPLLASLGIERVEVQKKIKVAFFSTGDELRQVGEKLNLGDIYDSNRYLIHTWLLQMHCEPLDLGVIPDNKAALKAAFMRAAQANLIISSGGVSVGDADFIKDVLAEEGTIHLWKLAIKPGKPFAFGSIHHTFFCALPGNPVSALVTLHVLVRPLIAKLSSHSQWQPAPTLSAIALTTFKKSAGRTDYQRAFYFVNEQAQLVVRGIKNQSSGAFSSMLKANCFAILEQERGDVLAGETVMIEPFDATLN